MAALVLQVSRDVVIGLCEKSRSAREIRSNVPVTSNVADIAFFARLACRSLVSPRKDANPM